jgi:hypothetical protein
LGQTLSDARFMTLDPSLGIFPGGKANEGRVRAWNLHLDNEGPVVPHDLVGRP